MISYRKSFDFTASDDELYDYVEKMIDVMVGDIDPKVEFDFESDDNYRYVNFKILNKFLISRDIPAKRRENIFRRSFSHENILFLIS